MKHSDELISKQALLDELLKEKRYYQMMDDCVDQTDGILRGICKATRIVEDAPAVDSVRHGYWIEYQEQRTMGLMNFIKCSECEDHHIKSVCGNPKYCSNCGAKMRMVNK